MQHKATLWILDVFYISLTQEIKAIADLILVHLHFQKLSGRYQLRTSTLLSNHAIKSLLKGIHANDARSHYIFLENMIFIQQLKIKNSIVNANNYFNGIFLLFDSLNKELFLALELLIHSPVAFYSIKLTINIKKANWLIFENLIT